MNSDSTTILFGPPGVRAQRVVRAADGARVVHVVTEDEAAAACPVCGVISTSVRQRRTDAPRDVPYGEEPLVVRWHKVQYSCQEDACPRRAFTERPPEVPAGARVTGRLRRHVADRIGEELPVTTAGGDLLGWPAAHDAFVAAVVAQLPAPSQCRPSASTRPAVVTEPEGSPVGGALRRRSPEKRRGLRRHATVRLRGASPRSPNRRRAGVDRTGAPDRWCAVPTTPAGRRAA